MRSVRVSGREVAAPVCVPVIVKDPTFAVFATVVLCVMPPLLLLSLIGSIMLFGGGELHILFSVFGRASMRL